MGPLGENAASVASPDGGLFERQRLLAALFSEYAAPLRRFFRRRGHSAEDALDLVQDVFVRLSGCDIGLIRARPGCMVFRLARFVSVDARRHSQMRLRVGLAPWDSLGDVEVDDGRPSPEQLLVWRQAIAGAVAAIQSLPPKGGQAYWLSRVGELTHREIAAVQGVSMKTVEKHIAASAGRFRAILAADSRLAA